MNEAGARLLEYVRSDVQLARDIYKTYLKSMQTIEAVQAKSSKVSKSDYVAVVEVDSALADARKEHSQNAQTAAMLFNKAMSHFPVAVADTLVRVAHIQNEQTAALSTQLAHGTRVLAKTEADLAALRHTHGKQVAPKAADADASEASGSALSLSQGSSEPGLDTSDEQQTSAESSVGNPSPRKRSSKRRVLRIVTVLPRDSNKLPSSNSNNSSPNNSNNKRGKELKKDNMRLRGTCSSTATALRRGGTGGSSRSATARSGTTRRGRCSRQQSRSSRWTSCSRPCARGRTSTGGTASS